MRTTLYYAWPHETRDPEDITRYFSAHRELCDIDVCDTPPSVGDVLTFMTPSGNRSFTVVCRRWGYAMGAPIPVPRRNTLELLCVPDSNCALSIRHDATKLRAIFFPES